MEISLYGADCLLVTTKQLQLLFNPPSAKTGLKTPKTKHEATLYSAEQTPPTSFKNGEQFSIDMAGEYEIKGVAIQGIAALRHIDKAESPKTAVMYVVEAAGLRLLVTGNITSELSDAQVDHIGEVNIMAVPVGGHGLTLDANAAAAMVSRFEPQYVIPVHYDDGATKYEMPQEKLEPFLKEMGSEGVKPEPKLKVNAKELGEDTKIVVLEVSK